jgi:AcrR family transcriptional regulator
MDALSTCYGDRVPRQLPMLDPPPRPERADAARNRQRILDAAAGLFAGPDPRDVSMEDIAKAAGVGRATLYRRYPTVGEVAGALLDEHERRLQERLLTGPPPLGPGAPPVERLIAFYGAMTKLLEQHSRLVLGTQVGRVRFATGAYKFWHVHVRVLLVEHGAADVDVLADTLLAPLAPDLYLHQRRSGASRAAITRTLQRLAAGVLAADG